MWCIRAIHKTLTDLGLNFRNQKYLQKGSRGLFLVVGIQNNVFKVGKKQWKFNEEKESPIARPNPWRHIVVVIDDQLYHYDCPEGKLSKYLITRLLGKYEDGKYMIRGEKVYEIQPKHQEKWTKRTRHVKDLRLDIGCLSLEQQCVKSRRETRFRNMCPFMDCGGAWFHRLEGVDRGEIDSSENIVRKMKVKK